VVVLVVVVFFFYAAAFVGCGAFTWELNSLPL